MLSYNTAKGWRVDLHTLTLASLDHTLNLHRRARAQSPDQRLEGNTQQLRWRRGEYELDA